MYKYCNKAQDFVNEWNARLGLPELTVKLCPGNDSYGMYCCATKARIDLYPRTIKDREDFVSGLLHEICHWWYYNRFKDSRWMSEERVMILEAYLLREFYPSYFDVLIRTALRIVSNFKNAKKYMIHYQGYVRVLTKFGVITDVKKYKS